MYSKTIIAGVVGRSPEMRYLPSGVAICDFSVAVNKRRGKGAEATEETQWYKVTCWRERAETASQYIKKGMKILVEGEVKASAYMDKSGKPQASLELTASDFKFLSSKADSQNDGEQSYESQATTRPNNKRGQPQEQTPQDVEFD